MKISFSKSILLLLVFSSFSVFLFNAISFNFSTVIGNKSPDGNWGLQNFSGLLNGRIVSDITFIDSLTGFAVTNNYSSGDTGYVLKTTNGGDNWFVNFNPFKSLSKIVFVNDSIGFACGGTGGGTAYFCRTTNKGVNWSGSIYGGAAEFIGISVSNKDTIYVVDDDGLIGGVFLSINGGLNWSRIYFAAQYNPTSIYMLNSSTGFITDGGGYLRKTTNGGYNWTQIQNAPGFGDIHFLNSLTGYIANGFIYKTTNGGSNWTTQVLPTISVPGGFQDPNMIQGFCFVNKDTIWAVGSLIQYPPAPYRMRGILNKTTNGGLNWGYQIPDTHYVTIPGYRFIKFSNKMNGWAYLPNGRGIHTITGGYDTTLYTDIKKEVEKLISKDFKLYQNYPNPFNVKTKIKYKIPERSFVEIYVYDIKGREISKIEEKLLNSGEYETNFNAEYLSSGIYFYALKINGINVFTKKMILIK